MNTILKRVLESDYDKDVLIPNIRQLAYDNNDFQMITSLIEYEQSKPNLNPFLFYEKYAKACINQTSNLELVKKITEYLYDKELITKDMLSQLLADSIDNDLPFIYCQLYIDLGADIHEQEDWALRNAARYGRLDLVKYLVERGAEINVHFGEPLFLAAGNGYLDVVKYLIENKADIHSDSECALETAISNNNLDVVKYLVSQGADIHVDNNDILKRAKYSATNRMIKYLESLP